MHIFTKTIFIVLCAIFAAPVAADETEEFVSFIEHNFPYEEVDESYGTANIENGQCQKGIPFSISQNRFQTTNEMNLAKQVHERLRSMGANGFVIIELKEETLVRTIKVVPLTCVSS